LAAVGQAGVPCVSQGASPRAPKERAAHQTRRGASSAGRDPIAPRRETEACTSNGNPYNAHRVILVRNLRGESQPIEQQEARSVSPCESTRSESSGTTGGCGGTVAVLAMRGARSAIEQVKATYERETGRHATVVGG
jgi:hypothetical protein